MKKNTKLPNGFGCIKRLSGNRRKPYATYLKATSKPVPAKSTFLTTAVTPFPGSAINTRLCREINKIDSDSFFR